MEERYTDIRLVKVPLEIDNKNQLTFSSKQTQYNYFNGCEHIELDDSSYQRKDNIIRYPGHIDNLIGYNYCMYRNNTYTDKWYYAYITDMKYISDSMTLISIKTDVWQTWNFDLEIKRCFVEREHVNDDTIGANTLPEQLETGEYIIEGEATSSTSGTCHAVIATTYDIIDDITGEGSVNPYHTYNGIPNGCYYYIGGSTTAVSFISLAISAAANHGKSDGIVSIFLLPDSLLGITPSTTWSYLYSGQDGWSTNPSAGLGYAPYKKISESTVATLMETVTVTKPYSTVNGYTPKNKKLFVAPYKYLVADNNSGAATELYYEFFGAGDMSFKIYGDITPGGSIKMLPQSYKNQTENNLEGLTSGKFPIGSFANDVYTNWLTQNAVNIGVKGAGALVSAGAGIAMGNPLAVAGAGLQVASTIGEIYQHSLIPPTVEGNVNSGDVNYSKSLTKFSFYKMSIKAEVARVIDEYFSTYGYKVARIKVPNITGRLNWNYVKTIDCNMHAYIPQEDLLEIKNMFNSGVTFWHNPLTFLDYSQANTIVS